MNKLLSIVLLFVSTNALAVDKFIVDQCVIDSEFEGLTIVPGYAVKKVLQIGTKRYAYITIDGEVNSILKEYLDNGYIALDSCPSNMPALPVKEEPK